MIRECLYKLSFRQSLSEGEAYDCMVEILEGKATAAQIASYLSFLNAKGESVEEVVGSVKAMREKMVRLNAEGLNAIDVCGTGGDHKGTFNISTAAALVLAGGDVTVAKHGNRAASSKCGSAEVLEVMGVKIDPTVLVIERCLQEANIGFLFAPHFHPAMKYVAPIRKELGIRTLFNILGPMCNPAGVKRQVIGIFDGNRATLIAEAMVRSGSERVIVLHSKDGLDEVSCAEETHLYEWYPDKTKEHKMRNEMKISPKSFKLQSRALSEILGDDAAANAKIVMNVLNGEKGPYRDIVVMNAAVGFYVAGKVKTIPEGRQLAEESIDSKKALYSLQTLTTLSHS